MAVVEKTDLCFDLAALTNALSPVEFNETIPDQISLTHRPGAITKGNDGNGSLRETQVLEREFTEFNSDFSQSYFYTVYQQVVAWSSWGIGRVRLMRVSPHRCYSIHHDNEPRYHIAIQTNPKCFLFFADEQRGYHIPADGHLYFTDTRIPHTAFNGSSHDRVHLVFTTYTTS